ncbi:hypothetical protein MYX82_04475 [Acidobacteria bacterium AH-259-D05]|nr:hypothetical protein [Acidobacteria bacterium AH-259-D05]
MRPKEVLERIPGLRRDHLTMWERQGYLQPDKIERGRIKRRSYTKRDLQIVEAMWPYYQKGVMPREAYKRALLDLGWEELRARAPPAKYPLKTLFETHKETVEMFLEKVFVGEELSLEEICLRTLSLLNSQEHREKLTELVYLLPIQQTSSDRYSYRPSNKK